MPGRESEPRRERQEDTPYVKAAQYRSDEPALLAYKQAQDLIFATDCDLSAYRIRFKDSPHVVVIGTNPLQEIDQRLGEILKSGQQTSLPPDVVNTLVQRRRAAGQLGPWVEGHYRPGLPT